ncbi:hypothetical protein DY000_02012228 [Brassica cretica]|uniref:DUF4283 domain-containing protein n=1 Tax=Brassica cretica TaxID=69181 RepID=A0ABQ7CRZ9_BRACR|nr:hypothetical protein DY000_02012228 [Brassica cretica]
MQSCWNVPGRASVMSPASLTSGEAPPEPPCPPDPPDPEFPLTQTAFPPLKNSNPHQKLKSKSLNPRFLSSPPITAASTLNPAVNLSSPDTSMVDSEATTSKPTFGSKITVDGPEATVRSGSGSALNTQPQQKTNPLLIDSSVTNRVEYSASSPKGNAPPKTPSPSNTHPIQPHRQMPAPTLVERLRAKENKTLQRLALISLSETGRPRVLIPDAVFHKGAEMHKDFIICYFNGRPPPFAQIQSVLNHMWGKGRKLEIHNNPLNRSALVRISSDYLREKILEKSIWYVGDSMFHTALWSSAHSSSTPPLKAIQIWAHLTGVPLDLRHTEGLSLVAGLVGHPKETDDFTLNLVSLTLSHVKVEVDLTEPLPSVVEFERESGEVVEVQVDYPWVPPTCSHCKELGHIVRNCLTYTPPPKDNAKKVPTPKKVPAPKKSSQPAVVGPSHVPAPTIFKDTVPIPSPPPPLLSPSNLPTPDNSLPSTPQKTLSFTFGTTTTEILNPSLRDANITLPSSEQIVTPQKVQKNKQTHFKNSFGPLSNLPPFDPSPFTPSEKPSRPSLKRSRSSPTLSPPLPSKSPSHHLQKS